MTDELDSPDVTNIPQEMAIKHEERQARRDPETGQFLKGWKGGGRPKGAKDKLNQQVIGTMERLWSQRGDEIMEHLADTKPEVLAGLIARLIPQSLAAEAIEGGETEKGKHNQEVTIRLVQQSSEPALPPREVEGDVLPPEDSVH